jgi:citrate lyase subunit beta/citryl-CoA lyase
MSRMQQLRRSFLYVGPTMPAMLDASRDIAADVLCFDLEDGTPPARKIEARDLIRTHLAGGAPRAREVVVRVNTLDTEWGVADLRFAAERRVDGVLLPKVEGDGMVRQAREVLAGVTDRPPALWVMIETALGVLRAEQIAAAGVEGIVIGGADLSESLGVCNVDGRAPLLPALGHVLIAARAFDVTAIDSIHHDYRDLTAIQAATEQAADLGFDGKSVFSAETAAMANRLFRPSAAAIAHAEALLGGSEIHGAHRTHARAILGRAKLAAEADGS